MRGARVTAGKTIRRIGWAAAMSVAAFLSFVAGSYRHDLSAARSRVAAGSKVAQTACGPIEYADVGSGPVVFAIHGAGGGFDQSLDIAADFLPTGYRLIAPSRFGYLRTPFPPDSSPAAQADAHACLLDALNVPKAIVVGGSMGAPSAMQLCLRHRERCTGLILLFPIAYAPQRAFAPPSGNGLKVIKTLLGSDFIFWAVSKFPQESVMRTLMATPVEDFRAAGPEEQQRALRTLRHVLPVSLRREGLMSDSATSGTIPRYDLERLAAPTLVLAAEDDLFGTYQGGRYTAEHVFGARFVGYRTGGHLLLGHREEVKAELAQFLNEHAAH